MNSITKTEYWEGLQKNIKIEDTLLHLLKNRDNYKIDFDLYSHLSEFKTYKYPMVKTTEKLLAKGTIIPSLLAEPPIKKAKPLLLPNLFTIPFSDRGNYKIIVDLSSKGKLEMDKISGSYSHIDIDPKTFYGFIQSAASSYIMLSNADSLKSGSFAKKTASLHVRMLAKVIDRIHPFSRDSLEYDTLVFVLTAYVYRCMFEYTMEDAYSLALRNAPGTKENIKGIALTINAENSPISKFSDVIGICEKNVRTLKPSALSYRGILRSYIQTFGPNSIYAIEHFGSFIQMIQMSNIWLGMYNDRSVNNMTSKDIKEIETTLASYSV